MLLILAKNKRGDVMNKMKLFSGSSLTIAMLSTSAFPTSVVTNHKIIQREFSVY